MTRLGEWVGQQMGLKMKRAITVINEIYYSYTNYCGLLPIKSDIGIRDSASTEKSHRGYITMSTMLSHNNHAVVVRSFNVVDTMHGILYNSYYARVP